MEETDKFSSIPTELKLYIWEILETSIEEELRYKDELKAKWYLRMMVLNREWFHFFALKLYYNEVNVAKVLSHNLDDTSKRNRDRLEELYTSYVSRINCVARGYHHPRHKLFWRCMDAFNYKLRFPNLKVLAICYDTQLPVSPRISLVQDLDELVFYQGARALQYSELKKFCEGIQRSRIKIGKLTFITQGYKVNFLAHCTPALCCEVGSIEYHGVVRPRQLHLLATNETCTSLSLDGVTSDIIMSPAVEGLSHRLSFLQLNGKHLGSFLKAGSNERVTLENLRHLRAVSEAENQSHTAANIPVVCPNTTQLDLVLPSYVAPSSIDQGACIAQALDDLDGSFSRQLQYLKVEIGYESPEILERVITNTDWSRYSNLTKLGLSCMRRADYLHEVAESQAPNMPSVEFV